MASPNTLLGILSKLYYNTATYGSPTWAPINLIGDFKLTAKWAGADILTRSSRVKFRNKTALEIVGTGKLLASLADTAYVAMQLLMLGDDVGDFLVLNGTTATNGVKGFRFDAQVFDSSEDQGPENVVWEDFELAPALTGNPPKSALVTSGAPVFTAI